MKTTIVTLALLLLTSPVLAQNQEPGGHFITSWDVDGDGEVGLEDITIRRGDVFVTFDADENGALAAEEYVLFDEARANDVANNGGHGNGQGMRRASEGMTLAFNDTDQDGEVSRAEFMAQAEAWMVLLDRNADGSVTTADFGRQ